MNWKYGLILVEVSEDGEQLCELVELYRLDDSDTYGAFCPAQIMSPEELSRANKDVERDGVNRYFYDHGTFTRQPRELPQYEWDWRPKG
jgi:hypothetical protein